ncbi:hypothetical protein SAY87_029341 [Trapa incisa]|uniref:Transmembrane protein n=1 Tax=Trapa incisa TaxID=236973 RepID=A0AAN7K812_9MYRT|nr:hypothetical protein SAY87_029341 [Trapa incisa]
MRVPCGTLSYESKRSFKSLPPRDERAIQVVRLGMAAKFLLTVFIRAFILTPRLHCCYARKLLLIHFWGHAQGIYSRTPGTTALASGTTTMKGPFQYLFVAHVFVYAYYDPFCCT